jgi:hypothetical protein
LDGPLFWLNQKCSFPACGASCCHPELNLENIHFVVTTLRYRRARGILPGATSFDIEHYLIERAGCSKHFF